MKGSNFAQELERKLAEFTDEVTQIIKKNTEEVAEDSLNILIETAPVLNGKYKKALKKTKSFEGATDVRFTLHAKNPEYRKTHLLENGHATRNGGRTKAIPHFEKANGHAIKALPKKIEEDIKKIN